MIPWRLLPRQLSATPKQPFCNYPHIWVIAADSDYYSVRGRLTSTYLPANTLCRIQRMRIFDLRLIPNTVIHAN